MTDERKESKETAKDLQARTGAIAPRAAVSPFEEMDRWMESFFPRSMLRPMRWDWPSMSELAAPFEGKMPRVDVVDRESDIVVRAELPGVDRKDVEVSLSDNTVTIKGSTSRETKEEKGNYFRREISRGSFARTVALPSDVDADKAKAAFNDGMLEITVPKVEKAKRRTIKVD